MFAQTRIEHLPSPYKELMLQYIEQMDKWRVEKRAYEMSRVARDMHIFLAPAVSVLKKDDRAFTLVEASSVAYQLASAAKQQAAKKGQRQKWSVY
jgi:hypothetical protein